MRTAFACPTVFRKKVRERVRHVKPATCSSLVCCLMADAHSSTHPPAPLPGDLATVPTRHGCVWPCRAVGCLGHLSVVMVTTHRTHRAADGTVCSGVCSHSKRSTHASLPRQGRYFGCTGA